MCMSTIVQCISTIVWCIFLLFGYFFVYFDDLFCAMRTCNIAGHAPDMGPEQMVQVVCLGVQPVAVHRAVQSREQLVILAI